MVGQDHTVQLPKEVPEGPADILVFVKQPQDVRARTESAVRRRQAMGTASGEMIVPDDFDAPLPPELLRYFQEEDGVPMAARAV
jgi:hypothetical protein